MSNWTKDRLLDWLQRNGKEFDPKTPRKYLWYAAMKMKEEIPPEIDAIAKEYGVTILRLPEYHPGEFKIK